MLLQLVVQWVQNQSPMVQMLQMLMGDTANSGHNSACEFYETGEEFQCSDKSHTKMWQSTGCTTRTVFCGFDIKVLWIYSKTLGIIRAALCVFFNFHGDIILCFSVWWAMIYQIDRQDKIWWAHHSYQNHQLCSRVQLFWTSWPPFCHSCWWSWCPLCQPQEERGSKDFCAFFHSLL